VVLEDRRHPPHPPSLGAAVRQGRCDGSPTFFAWLGPPAGPGLPPRLSSRQRRAGRPSLSSRLSARPRHPSPSAGVSMGRRRGAVLRPPRVASPLLPLSSGATRGGHFSTAQVSRSRRRRGRHRLLPPLSARPEPGRDRHCHRCAGAYSCECGADPRTDSGMGATRVVCQKYRMLGSAACSFILLTSDSASACAQTIFFTVTRWEIGVVSRWKPSARTMANACRSRCALGRGHPRPRFVARAPNHGALARTDFGRVRNSRGWVGLAGSVRRGEGAIPPRRTPCTRCPSRPGTRGEAASPARAAVRDGASRDRAPWPRR
jgi:hypothetical protein